MTNEQINATISKILNADEHWMIQKNYCNDLNAMHEVEKSLKNRLFENYLIKLLDFTDEPMHATSRHRAEAFLRTLGKWEEAK